MATTSTPSTGKQVTVAGQAFWLSPVTSFRNLGMIRDWLRDHGPNPYRDVAAALAGLAALREFDPEAYGTIRADLLRSAAGAADLAAQQNPLDAILELCRRMDERAVTFLFWLSVRVKHPDLTQEGFKALVAQEDVLALVPHLVGAFGAVNGDGLAPPEGPTPASPPS